jgi:hypothetical protein
MLARLETRTGNRVDEVVVPDTPRQAEVILWGSDRAFVLQSDLLPGAVVYREVGVWFIPHHIPGARG